MASCGRSSGKCEGFYKEISRRITTQLDHEWLNTFDLNFVLIPTARSNLQHLQRPLERRRLRLSTRPYRLIGHKFCFHLPKMMMMISRVGNALPLRESPLDIDFSMRRFIDDGHELSFMVLLKMDIFVVRSDFATFSESFTFVSLRR